MATAWTVSDIPDQTGRTVVITGANSGIGLEAARGLAAAGARVVMACRDPKRAEAAAAELRRGIPKANLEVAALDLASLSSIRSFAKHFGDQRNALHVLINNAGVMALPRCTTADGFEMQFGTNHLGHFALTGLLLERLLATPGARVVTVSSAAHRAGKMRWSDLQGEQRYSRWGAYGQSKLANLLFAYELQRRLATAGHQLASVVCHPGYAATNLQYAAPRMDASWALEQVAALGNRLLAQDAAAGALPTLYAATAPDVKGSDFIGPDGFMEMWGAPVHVRSNAASSDLDDAIRLWEISASLTGVDYGLPKASAAVADN